MTEKPPGLTPETTATPIHFSKETFSASDAVSNTLTPQSVDCLTQRVEHDLAANGIPLSPKEKKTLGSKVKQFFFGEQTAFGKDIDPKLLEGVNLTDYIHTFQDLYHTYGMDKHKAKFGILAGLIIQGKVIGDLAGTSASSALMTLWQEKQNLPKTKSMIGRFVASKWVPDAQLPDQRPMAPGIDDVVDVGGELGGLAKKFKWPLAIVATYIPSGIAEVMAEFRMVDAMKTVRLAINERAASSLVMRDMEFTQDKSAAEINNILEKGKQSTLDMFQTTYSEVLPRIFAIGLASAGQIPFNPIGGILQLTRLPFLYKSSMAYAKAVLTDRAADLQRKDFIDTRINATLGSLEVVKSSDSMDRGVTELTEYMKERDTAKSQQSKEALKQGIKRDIGGMGFSLGIPAVTAGLERLIYGKKAHAAEKGIITLIGESIVRKNAEELVELFTDKIQPALQDIRRMEELLGPYDKLDKPDGKKEASRVEASTIRNFDIFVRDLNYRDIVTNASLDIPQGSFVTIKGPSGSGKTSLLRSMLGLYTSADNAVQYGGVSLDGIKKYGPDSIYTKFGYANQNTQFFENMTLKENLLLWTKKDVPDARIKDVLHELRLDGIVDRLDSTVKHFSGGELRRIGIARALLKDPKVLFLDEPTSNLDDESARQVVHIIQDMRKKRPDMTVVAVTHDPNFEKIAERVVDMREINKPNQVRYGEGKAS